jgi:hypothetical protein
MEIPGLVSSRLCLRVDPAERLHPSTQRNQGPVESVLSCVTCQHSHHPFAAEESAFCCANLPPSSAARVRHHPSPKSFPRRFPRIPSDLSPIVPAATRSHGSYFYAPPCPLTILLPWLEYVRIVVGARRLPRRHCVGTALTRPMRRTAINTFTACETTAKVVNGSPRGALGVVGVGQPEAKVLGLYLTSDAGPRLTCHSAPANRISCRPGWRRAETLYLNPTNWLHFASARGPKHLRLRVQDCHCDVDLRRSVCNVLLGCFSAIARMLLIVAVSYGSRAAFVTI